MKHNFKSRHNLQKAYFLKKICVAWWRSSCLDWLVTPVKIDYQGSMIWC